MVARERLAETIAEGNLLSSLEIVRDAIAEDIERCESQRDKAALYLRLADVLQRIEETRPTESGGDVVDEVSQRRSARRAGSA